MTIIVIKPDDAMTNELVSALLDGECSQAEVQVLLNQIGQSPALMRQWSRMSLVRDAMAGYPVQNIEHLDADVFCAGVMGQLGEMAPADQATAEAVAINGPRNPARNSGKVVQLVPRRAAAAPRVRRSRPLMGWAAAASVTLVALAGSRAWLGSDPQQSSVTSIASAAAENEANGEVRPVSYAGAGHFGLMPVSSNSVANESAQMRWSHLDPDVSSGTRLDASSGTNDAAPEYYHLHIDQNAVGGRRYSSIAGSGASYQSVSDTH